MSDTGTPKILVNDDPFDKAVAKYERKQAPLASIEQPAPVNRERELEERIVRLENLLQETLDSLNAATIECTGGDVVLTLPDLPT